MCAKSEYDALGNVIKKDMEKEILKKLNPTPTSKGFGLHLRKINKQRANST